MSLPALQALRRRYPDAYIAVLARPWVADLYEFESFCDEVIPYTVARGWKDLAGKWGVAQELKRRGFDTAILLPNSFEAAALAWLAGIPRRIGFNRDGRRWLLTHPIAVPEKGETPPHERFYYVELLRRAGLVNDFGVLDRIQLEGSRQLAQTGRERFDTMGWTGVVGVSPGAAYGTAKRWLPERFAESAAALGGQVALFGTAEEHGLCEEIRELLQVRNISAHNFAGQTSLKEFIELVAGCRVFLTNDSGGMHIASALGVPTVAIFGATDHTATGPTGPLARVVREPVECSPCLLRECPIDHRCMTRVSSKEVIDVSRELLSKG